MQITAAVLTAQKQPFELQSLTLAEPEGDEVRVKVLATGLCHTDLVVQDGEIPLDLPLVLGHEGAGYVEAVGSDVTKVKPGDPVVLTFGSCGTCNHCEADLPPYCIQFVPRNLSGRRPNGEPPFQGADAPVYGAFFQQSSFATYALARQDNVVQVRADAPLAKLGPLGCGVQTGAGAVLNTFKAGKADSLAIFGAGSVGLSALLAAKATGVDPIIVVDPLESRRAAALELGATEALDPMAGNVTKAIRAKLPGGATYTLDTTGKAGVIRDALEATAIRGTCGILGVPDYGAEVSVSIQSLLSGRTLTGIMEGDSQPDVFIPELINLHMEGRFPFDRLITEYPLEEINQAAEDSKSGKVIKPVLVMPHEGR